MTTHHIKVASSTTSISTIEWTEKLAHLASTFENEILSTAGSSGREELSRFLVLVDGPYGRPLDASLYEHVLFVAGGIGITPLISTYKHIFLSRYDLNQWSFAHMKNVRFLLQSIKYSYFFL